MSNLIKYFEKKWSSKLVIIFLMASIFLCPVISLSNEINDGEVIFNKYCSACHIQGGNIIRRGKTLKLEALHRRGLDNPEAIAEIARLGIGIMNGYSEVLKDGEDKVVADWILKQAQNAWIHG